MPIESEIPVEIEDYRRKVIFGLTGRQLLCLVLAVALGVGAFFLCVRVLHLSIDAAGWVVMLLACPLMGVGFVRPNGEPFEKFLAQQLRRLLRPARLYYEAEPEPFTNTAKAERSTAYAHSLHRAEENTWRYRPGTGRKRKRKQTASRVKAAQKEYRKAAARARKAAVGAPGA